jgi:PAS domain S-box-containing protein
MPFNSLPGDVDILSYVTESVIVVNTQAEIVFYNRVTESYNDLSDNRIRTGISLYDLLDHAENQHVIRFAISEVLSTAKANSAELVIPSADGISTYFEVTLSPIPDSTGEVKYICVVSRDITPQKIFEKKTLQLVRELSTLIENANAVIFGIDGQEYVTEWNNECVRITGFQRGNVLGKNIRELLPESDFQHFSKLSSAVLAGNAVSNFQFYLSDSDSRRVVILLNGTAKLSSSGKVVGALFVGQDVTELMEYRVSLENKVKDRTIKLREALQKEKELVEIKNKFVSIASHEFKVPLNAITSSVERLKKTAQPHQNENIEKINEHVSRMKTLLEDVLNIEKHEGHKLRPNIRPVIIDDFLKRLINEVSDATGNSHVFITEFPETPITFYSDEKLLRNIFVNLFNNAVKFSPDDDTVMVRLDTADTGILVTVQDFGIGIPDEDLERIFQAFNRGTNVAEIKGTGLGLSIVKRAVESLSGELFVQSIVGEGTVFGIHFPFILRDE